MPEFSSGPALASLVPYRQRNIMAPELTKVNNKWIVFIVSPKIGIGPFNCSSEVLSSVVSIQLKYALRFMVTLIVFHTLKTSQNYSRISR